MDKIELQEIPLDAIIPDPNQPRNLRYSLDELIEKAKSDDHLAQGILDKLSELATSILESGLQQPITVYPSEKDGKFIIYDGHRRWLAAQLIRRQGLRNGTITCYIRSTPKSDYDTLLGQLDANIQREGFNIFELARSLQQVHKNFKKDGGVVRIIREDGSIKTIELGINEPDDIIWNAIEKKMGISRSRRYQIQAVLKLSPHIQRIAEETTLPESRLRYIIPLKDEQIQETIIREIVEKNLSNADIKKRIKELQEASVTPPDPAMPKPMRIKSAINPISRLVKEMEAVRNIPNALSAKDPRTVETYRKLIPELRSAIEDLEVVLTKLEFLEEK